MVGLRFGVQSRVRGPALRPLRIFVTCWVGQGRAFRHLILVPLLLPVCVLQCHSQTAQGGSCVADTISGTVLNSVTHEPIGRALVYSADERFATLTDDHGHFELSMPEPPQSPEARWMGNGQPVLQAKKPGYLAEQGPHGKAIIGPNPKEVTLSLVPEGLIVGQVKFPSAEAADRAQVMLYRREVRDGFAQWAPLTQVRTRADGEFRLADLRAGEYKVFTLEAVERDPLANVPNGPVFGFPPRFFAAARDFATADTIQVRAGETITANITPEQQRYYDVRVPVAGAEASAPQGLQVSVHAQGHRGPGFALGYDSNQHAIRGSLPNGSYLIEAASYEPGPATGLASITVENAPVNAPPLTMKPNVSIEINVRQDNTAAQPSLYVTLQSAEEFSVERGSGGTYQSQGNPPVLAGVSPGRYWVQVQPSQSGIYVASATSGPKDLLRAPLVVPFGASVPPIDITVRNDPAEIDATVDGKPFQYSSVAVGDTIGSVGRNGPVSAARGLSVYCVPAGNDGSPVREFFNLPDGSFTLQQLPPGDFRILAFDTPQQLEYRNPVAMRIYETMGQVVHLTPGQKLQVQLQPIANQ